MVGHIDAIGEPSLEWLPFRPWGVAILLTGERCIHSCIVGRPVSFHTVHILCIVCTLLRVPSMHSMSTVCERMRKCSGASAIGGGKG
jgi:hypothetical protein